MSTGGGTTGRAAERIAVRRAEAGDLSEVVRAHMQAFQGYFLTTLGPAFLEAYYGAFLHANDSVLLVATIEGEIAGFVAGTIDVERLYARLYRPNFARLAFIVARRLLTDNALRSTVGKRLPHLKFALRVLLHRRHAEAHEPAFHHSAVPARLLSIGVFDSARGSGAAARLAEAFCQEMKGLGHATVGLSVLRTNERAIAFYDKTGWKREHTHESSIYYTRVT
jgi:ribosomal protein S18 acetylase RimI-like enzyme